MDIKKQHYTFSHYDDTGEKRYKAKKAYESEKEAVNAARMMNLKPQTIHKYRAYKCNMCQKWHIGKNTNKELSDRDIERIYRKYNYAKSLCRYNEK